MPGTEDAQGPFFSPDSEWVGFFAGGKLKKIAAAGGAPEVVADAVWGSGADWGADGQIYFAPTEAVGVWRVPSSEGSAGGSAEPVVLPPVAGHPWPALLPGNQRLLVNYGDPAVSVAVAAVGGSTPPEILVDFGSAARYAPTGHLVYGREGRLVARPFDAETIRFTGDEATLFDGVRMESAGAVQATWSADGTLVYAPGSDGARGELVWIDRQQGRAPLGLQAAFYGDFELSPDGSALVYVLREGTRQRLWLYPLDRAAPQPLTQGPSERGPHWDIEGDALFFHASDPEGNHLYRIVVTDAAEAPLEVTRPAGVLSVLAVRDDGLFLVSGDDMGTDIVFAPFGDDRASLRLDESRMVVATAAREIFPNVSPDGRWLAYTSDETGGWEIYVTNLPDATIKRRVSLGGGEEPRWSPDGREIIYRYGPRWYSVSFSAEPGLELGSSTLLFEGPFINVPGYSWDISRDGGRFLVIENPDQDQALTELTMISNFFDELRRKAPSRR
jgi:serine/threonine-protein kinase